MLPAGIEKKHTILPHRTCPMGDRVANLLAVFFNLFDEPIIYGDDRRTFAIMELTIQFFSWLPYGQVFLPFEME